MYCELDNLCLLSTITVLDILVLVPKYESALNCCCIFCVLLDIWVCTTLHFYAEDFVV